MHLKIKGDMYRRSTHASILEPLSSPTTQAHYHNMDELLKKSEAKQKIAPQVNAVRNNNRRPQQFNNHGNDKKIVNDVECEACGEWGHMVEECRTAPKHLKLADWSTCLWGPQKLQMLRNFKRQKLETHKKIMDQRKLQGKPLRERVDRSTRYDKSAGRREKIICSFIAEHPDLDYATLDETYTDDNEPILDFNPHDPKDIAALDALLEEHEE